ncbi:MAG: tyrosine-type recombinase/integrase [Faecalicoccus sp.]|nr:tyrosine-type recombinase/integrase [Faecalicoccus sp.]
MYRIDSRINDIPLSEKKISVETFDYLSEPDVKKAHNYAAQYYVLKDFCRFLQMNGYTDIYCEEKSFHIQSNHIPVLFSRNEMYSIIEKADQKALEHRNDKIFRNYYGCCIILRLLYGCGLRIGEAMKIRYEDCNMALGTINIYNSKRKVSRVIVVSESLEQCLVQYAEYFDIQSGFLFTNRNGNKLSENYFRKFYHSVLSEMGYDPSIRVHDLRHTFTNEALEQMMNAGYSENTVLVYLSRYLGHNTISETEYYIHFTDRFKDRMIQANREFSGHLYQEVLQDEK